MVSRPNGYGSEKNNHCDGMSTDTCGTAVAGDAAA
jgi:hypothetical protein